MIRYLAIALAAGMLGLVLWLPASQPAAQFYQAARADHAACSKLWGRRFATAALDSALAMAVVEPLPRKFDTATAGPSGPAERRLAVRMQGMLDRIYGSPYMRGVDAMMTLALYRLATLGYLTVGICLFLVPAITDAAMRRIIRTYEFRRHDPERYAFALAGAMAMTVALFASCVLPMPLPPYLAPCIMLMMVYCLHVVLANFHHSGM
ncbi:MAG TPA: DUF4400 domain-containing protein [Pseudoduganella sp.]|jgi:hypothetical protein